MHASISARELFDQQRERLQLRWVAGQDGAGKTLESVDTVARRPSLAGYLNAIYPNKVQILGSEELSWLDTLDSRQRWETLQRIVHHCEPMCGCMPSGILRRTLSLRCQRTNLSKDLRWVRKLKGK